MTAPTAPARITGILRRTPATIATLVVLLTAGVLSRGLWEPFAESAGMYTWAYGLPALDDGRWWTPLTGTFFVVQPLVYIPTLVDLGALGALEYLRGSRVALAYFWVGQLFGVFGSALLLSLLRLFSGWTWAQEAASSLDVGPSAGALACIAALVGLAPAPWRTRGWMLLLTAVIVAVLVFGTVADLEDLCAVLLILVVDRTLRPQRATLREQRLVAFIGMLAFVAIETILAIVPTDGPFGGTEPLGGSFRSTAIDVVVVVVIANGLLRARRWAWVVALILLSINVLSAVGLALLLPATDALGVDVDDLGTVELEIGTGALSLLMLIYLISVRGAVARHRRTTLGGGAEPTVDEASALLRRAGGSSLSWMTILLAADLRRRRPGRARLDARPHAPARGRVRPRHGVPHRLVGGGVPRRGRRDHVAVGGAARPRVPARGEHARGAQRTPVGRARARLRLPVAAPLQGQVPAALRDALPALPRRGRPAAHRCGAHAGLPPGCHDPPVRPRRPRARARLGLTPDIAERASRAHRRTGIPGTAARASGHRGAGIWVPRRGHARHRRAVSRDRVAGDTQPQPRCGSLTL